MPDEPEDAAPGAEASGAQLRQAWFMAQRTRTMRPRDPLADVDEELTEAAPGDPHAQPAELPPPLADLMRSYRQRLQAAADAEGGGDPGEDDAGGGDPGDGT